MGLWACLATSIMNEEDDFRVRMRKSVLTILFLPTSIFFLGYAISALVRSSGAYAPPLYILSVVDFLVLVALFSTSYIFMRVKRAVTGLHLGVVFWTFVGLMQVFCMIFPAYDSKQFVFAVAALVLMTQMPGMMICLAFLTFQALFVDWNRACIISDNRQMLAAFPGWIYSETYTLFAALALTSSGTFVFIGVIYMFHLQIAEAERRGAAQHAANEMTKSVLQLHRKYNTEGVKKVLDLCTEEKVVDPELISLFQGLNENLDTYRPFLPNYLFQTEATAELDTEVVSEELNESTRSSPLFRKSSRGALRVEARDFEVHSDRSSVLSYSDIDDYNSSDGEERSSRTATTPQLPGRATPRNPLHAHHRKSVPHEAGGLIQSHKHNEQAFRGSVTFAVVDLQLDRLQGLFSSGAACSSADILSTVVNAIYQLSRETKASVHSMLGDTVQLTWNATHVLAQPEAKGALFLAKLRKVVAAAADPTAVDEVAPTGKRKPETRPGLSGAVCSGEAMVHSIYSAQQRTLVIEASWLPSVRCCLSLAKRHGAMLMDECTSKGSSFAVSGCAVDQMIYPATRSGPKKVEPNDRPGNTTYFLFNHPRKPGGGGGDVDDMVNPVKDHHSTLVYQILAEKSRQDDVEWMYQLDDNEVGTTSEGTAGSEKLLCALDAALDSSTSEPAAAPAAAAGGGDNSDNICQGSRDKRKPSPPRSVSPLSAQRSKQKLLLSDPVALQMGLIVAFCEGKNLTAQKALRHLIDPAVDNGSSELAAKSGGVQTPNEPQGTPALNPQATPATPVQPQPLVPVCLPSFSHAIIAVVKNDRN